MKPHIEKIEYAKVDKLNNIVQFILDYIEYNTGITLFLSPTLLYQKLSKTLTNQEQLSNRQYNALLEFLNEGNYIKLATKGKTEYSKENYIDATFIEDMRIIINPNMRHNRLCKEFNIDYNIEFDFD